MGKVKIQNPSIRLRENFGITKLGTLRKVSNMNISKKDYDSLLQRIEDLRIAGALRHTGDPHPPDLDPLAIGTYFSDCDAIQGWLPMGDQINFMWSGKHTHGSGKAPITVRERHNQIASQGSRCLYSSKVTALQKLRWLKEQEFAKVLARIDTLIEAAQAEGGS